MFYVYIIQSEKRPENIYIGVTNDLRRRFQQHNSGHSHYTKSDRPWRLICYLGLHTKQAAYRLEKYFKTGSGREFIRKRII